MINHFASQSQTCQLLIFFFFFTFKGNCEKWCNLRSNWWASTSNLKYPFSDSFKYKSKLSIGVVYNGHVKHIFTLCHSRQTNVATWFLVFPIDIKNKSTIANINIYRYIYAYIAIYRVFGIIFSRPLRSRWKQWYIEIYQVGDNWRTVNPSTSPHISGQLGTNNPC